MALHSRQRPRRTGEPSRNVTHADPYGPDSADYDARHVMTQRTVEGVPGLLRVDIGTPAPRP